MHLNNFNKRSSLSVSEDGALRVDAAASPCWPSRLINEDAAAA